MNTIRCLRPCFNTGGGRRTGSGFTLIELITVVAVVGVLAGLAAPSFSTLVANQRMKSVAYDLYTALSIARSEAIKRNTNVQLSPNAAGDWQAGWKILHPDDPMRTLADYAAVKGVIITVTESGAESDDVITYQSSGRIKGNSIPSFDISAAGIDTHWCGTVDLSGRPNVKKAASC